MDFSVHAKLLGVRSLYALYCWKYLTHSRNLLSNPKDVDQIHCLSGSMLPDLANQNTGCPIAFELQIFNTNLELAYMKSEVTQSCPTLCNPMDTRLLHP